MKHPLLRLAVLTLVAFPAALLLMWLVGGSGAIGDWSHAGAAIAVVFGSAVLFFPMLRLTTSARSVGFILCVLPAALAPLLIPPEAGGLRLLVAILALTISWKLYDLHRSPDCGVKRGFAAYLAYLPDWFWFVCRCPPRGWMKKDWGRLVLAFGLAVAGLGHSMTLFCLDWSGIPFLIEHCLKAGLVFFTTGQIGELSAALLRLIGYPAHEPTDNPFAARTPADFWRRWNWPVRQFLQVHVFEPLGGRRRLALATLATFAVSGLCHEYILAVAGGGSGWQILFFMVQGLATLATLRVRPRGAAALFWIAGTIVFNLAASLLFFRSVDAVVPFYWRGR